MNSSTREKEFYFDINAINDNFCKIAYSFFHIKKSIGNHHLMTRIYTFLCIQFLNLKQFKKLYLKYFYISRGFKIYLKSSLKCEYSIII